MGDRVSDTVEQIVVHSDQSLDDIEDRIFSVLERLKESLNGGKDRDRSIA